MTHTDLLRQALDALELQEPAVGCPREREHWRRTAMPTMDALRAALAQPEAEPVAYGMRNDDGQIFDCVAPDKRARYPGDYTVPLYTTPQAQPAPAVPDDAALNTLARVFHSGEEIEGDDGAAMMVDMALWNEGCEALESLIGEGDDETLASPAAPAVPDDMVMVPREPTQEMIDAADAIDPDQFWSEPLIQEDGTKHRTRDCDSVLYYRAMISAAPAVRKRLTDEQIDAISLRDGGVTYRQLARAIERAHGITGDSK